MSEVQQDGLYELASSSSALLLVAFTDDCAETFDEVFGVAVVEGLQLLFGVLGVCVVDYVCYVGCDELFWLG